MTAPGDAAVKMSFAISLPRVSLSPTEYALLFFGELPTFSGSHFLSTHRELEVPEFTSLPKLTCLGKR